MTDVRDPENDNEWQEAVDVSKLMLILNDLKLYGLIEGGPTIDTDRAEYLLQEGKRRGFTPREDVESLLR